MMIRHVPGGAIGSLGEDDRDAVQAIEEIFFASAPPRHLRTAADRQAFLHRWTSYYLHHERDQILLHRLDEDTVAGYLMGCLRSHDALPLYGLIEHYGLFKHHFAQFPGHFHINCHPAHRSKGVGSALVQRFIGACRAVSLPGIHVVTTTDARNVTFYRRLGFETVEERPFTGASRLLLGLRLS